MSTPYRDGEQREVTDAPTDRGIVGDVIAQFADLYAFYRELIQNSIDAGSPDVHIEIQYDDAEQRVRVSVRDRGQGMSRETIENQLLVLFRSTKEKERGKIGKFGVGFASVLSPNPEVVVVSSARDGKRLTLHLYRDLTYELFDAGRATQAGTTVELEILLGSGNIIEFEKASEAALRRWCRHASVPIHLVIRRGERKREERIDTPLAIGDSHVEVRRTFDNAELTVVAGLPTKTGPYLGFFNHGLMLYESTSDVIGKAAVKVQDSRLGHTISRDDVRRDGHYRHALASARKVVAEDLCAAASARMRELAEAGGGDAYNDLLDALVETKLNVGTWYFPLVEPIGGKRVITQAEFPKRVYTSTVSTPLTQALAESATPVLLATNHSTIVSAVEALGFDTKIVYKELTAVAAVEPSSHDIALVKSLRDMLDAVHRAPTDVVLVTLTGAREDLIAVALPETTTRMLDRDEAVKNPFSMFSRRVLGLSANHPHVKAAREGDDPVLAAAHLARAVLLQHGLLDAERSRAVLELALARMGIL